MMALKLVSVGLCVFAVSVSVWARLYESVQSYARVCDDDDGGELTRLTGLNKYKIFNSAEFLEHFLNIS